MLFSLPLTIEACLHIIGADQGLEEETYETYFHAGVMIDRMYLIFNPFIYTTGSPKLKATLRRAHCMKPESPKPIQGVCIVPPTTPVNEQHPMVFTYDETGTQLIMVEAIKRCEVIAKKRGVLSEEEVHPSYKQHTLVDEPPSQNADQKEMETKPEVKKEQQYAKLEFLQWRSFWGRI